MSEKFINLLLICLSCQQYCLLKIQIPLEKEANKGELRFHPAPWRDPMSKEKKHSLQLLGWIPQKCILGNFSQGSLAGYQCVFSWLQLGNNKLILRLLRIPLLFKLLTVKDLPPLNLDYALFADCCFCPRGCLRSSGGIQQILAVGGQPFRNVWTCYKWGTGADPWWRCTHGRSAAAHSPHRWSASGAKPGLPHAGSLLRRWSGKRDRGRHGWGSAHQQRQHVEDKLWDSSLSPLICVVTFKCLHKAIWHNLRVMAGCVSTFQAWERKYSVTGRFLIYVCETFWVSSEASYFLSLDYITWVTLADN